MLRIYQGRENIDKEQFIYERVKEESELAQGQHQTLVIVPDQYTLVAEEQAMKHLQTACLLNVEILSMNRLGLKMLEEQGIENVRMLNQYERFMILGRIIRHRREELDVFKLPSDKSGFVDMVSDFISDFKQQECSLEELRQMAETPEADSLFQKKIQELLGILEEYQDLVEGKYKDVADYAAMYTQAMRDSKRLQGQSIWIYGYDSMPPRFIDSIMALASVAKEVSVMVNLSDFGLDKVVVSALTRAAEEQGIPVSTEILTAPIQEQTETIRRIEASTFADYNAELSTSAAQGNPAAGPEAADEMNADFTPEGLQVVECATMYNEAENAAVYIYGLLRQGYRMKDISIICNDQDTMQSIVERTFQEYELPLFRDQRRMIRDSQVVSFAMGLLNICSSGYQTSSVLAVLKSALTGIAKEDIWNLENYARSYGIKGTMWQRPFKYGNFEYSEEEFQRLEELRSGLIAKIDPLVEEAKNTGTVTEFIVAFDKYLNDTWNLAEQIQQIQSDQVESGMLDEAQWTVQCYNEIIRVMDCVRNILGDDIFDIKEFNELFSVGILNTEVGMIPPTKDGLSIGTMIRSRTAPPKVVMVLSANEGTLPAEPTGEGLFSQDEKNLFQNHDFPLGHLDDLQQMEQNAAMYRMVSRPTEKLYISYSLADAEGSDKKPSILIESLKNLFPKLKIRHDVIQQGFGKELVQNPQESIRHMMNHYRERPMDRMAEMINDGQQGDRSDDYLEDDYLSEGILRWYEANEPARLQELTKAGLSENGVDPLSRETARRLYGKDGEFSFSASRLERYNHCPFKHYVNYGLRAEEQKEYRGDRREIGDVYHECMMRISRRLVKEGILQGSKAPDQPPTECLSEAHLAEMIDEELTEISKAYQGGLFLTSSREGYRMSRIRKICLDAVKVLAEQLATGAIELAFFEERFGRGCRFQALEYTLHGHKVYIEGKIDRIDVMRGGNVRVIDYKTGSDKLDLEKMKDGYKMQLMVYLDSASGTDKEPVGMFYFNIAEPLVSMKDTSSAEKEAKLAKDLDKSFKLCGAVMDEPEVLAQMPIEQLGSGKKLAQEDFRALREVVHKKIESISDDIVEGKIDIFPAKESPSNPRSECTYCDYKPICRFDLSYRNNNYRVVEKSSKK